MADRKRGRGGSDHGGRGGGGGGGFKKAAPEPTGPFGLIFQGYATALDAKALTRDNVIKANRDIGADAKKLIFLLHRVSVPGADRAAILEEAEAAIGALSAQCAALLTELAGVEYWRLHHSWTGGVQELLEGLSFYWYLKEDGALITMEQAQAMLGGFPLTPEDFLLGVSDLTGELMRHATNLLNRGDVEAPFRVAAAVSDMAEAFKALTVVPPFSKLGKELGRKQKETMASLFKLERLCYSLRLKRNADPQALLRSAMAATNDAPLAAGGDGD